jgi:molecular chaperone HtpG
MRGRTEVSEDQYKEFYHHVGHAFDEPWLTLHNRVEGKIEYTNLLFVPSARPFDLFSPERKQHVKLYVRRVFITDDCEELLPAWLRFVRGVVDSEDLPLNISREMLQHNPLLARIRAGLVKRILGELKKKSDKDVEGYARFWENFGAVLKEGLYEATDHRDDLLALARMRSTTQDGLTGLADYVGRMKDDQQDIYYITGDNAEAIAASPQLEAFRARGVEVLLLTDPVDEFWVPAIGTFRDRHFRSATRGDIDLDAFAKPDAAAAPEKAGDGEIASLTALFRLELKDAVKDVRASHRLTDSAVCLVADEGDLDMHLERLLRQHQQVDRSSPRILELNPSHPLIRSLATTLAEHGSGATSMTDVAWLLLDQARIVEGEPLPDPKAFARRLTGMMEKGLAF